MAAIQSLLHTILEHPGLRAAQVSAQAPAAAPESGVSISGLTRPGKGIAAALLAHHLARPAIILTSDNDAAERLAGTASTVLDWLEPGAGEAAVSLPAFDCSPYEARSPHPDILERRAVALWRIGCGKVRVLAAPLSAGLMRYRPAPFYGSLALRLKTSDELAPEDLAEHLLRVGYEPTEPVSTVGQFSVRGGIVDVFPPEAEWPVRIEFFGDSIESMREFDPASQRSRKSIAEILALPLTEAAPPSHFFSRLVDVLAKRNPEGRAGRLAPGWADSYSGPFPGWEFYVPLVEPHSGTLFSILERPAIIWDEPAELQAQLPVLLDSLQSGFDTVRDVSPQPPRPDEIFLADEEFQSSVAGLPAVFLSELEIEGNGESSGFPATPSQASRRFFLNSQPLPKFQGSLKMMADQLHRQLEDGESMVLAVPTSAKADRLREIFSDYEISYENVGWPSMRRKSGQEESAPASNPQGRALLIARGEIGAGVAFPDFHLVLLSERDVLGEFAWGAARRREGAASSFLSDLSDLKVGDYVVHVDHGIGVYQGLKQLPVGGVSRDFMLLTYQDDARLYVPLERLDLVEKYRSSGDGAKASLDRLGGTSWQRTKKRVQRALRDMAEELLRLYAERKMRGGTAVAPDNNWQKEFEDSFPFDETPDQLTAIADIKRDLESPEPMDRLLCGDVGYGKTELAMRAAFKVVQESRQVAVLAPTTVLAFQHYTTFNQRMSHFPVRIEMLSRFRSAAEIKKTVADIEAGKVDIVIGTHRLLSKDVQFQDLGLLVVDEEQRFGVAAKERLKKLKANVDVLTMSATPIPRTLHMALGGLRDLSVIESPPRGRLAIQTTVATFNDGLIQAAIQHEMERGGQIYFVHNRVESIFTIAALLQRLVPAARIGVAHGQMGERDLERVMLKFMEAKYDMLVATSLVENGLDIPRANTMIVNHAERFGLSDLYQLRGRVGRSDRRAYAYFLVPAVDTLTPIAKRRLAALREFSDLGAGFRLAALDLELRGAGNVLGQQQHGHLNAIGIDLYLRMLDEAVHELKGEPSRPEVRTTLNLGINIKIPESYIADERQRLRMYKRISALQTQEALREIEAELTDRYGPVPLPVTHLLNYAVLKSRAEQLMIQSVERKGSEVRMRFHEQTPVSPQRLMQIVKGRRGSVFQPDGVLRMQIKDGSGDPLEELENILLELQPQS
ncbi:MAG TPA: transcription-repair coupling factor [Terriglobia bacterium]|nr:transcription-repair coupling factor [Terriglobia bacterium]